MLTSVCDASFALARASVRSFNFCIFNSLACSFLDSRSSFAFAFFSFAAAAFSSWAAFFAFSFSAAASRFSWSFSHLALAAASVFSCFSFCFLIPARRWFSVFSHRRYSASLRPGGGARGVSSLPSAAIVSLSECFWLLVLII